VITINGKDVEFIKGETILEAAIREDIYIPTLCTHHELPSFGACRMCIVEVEKARGYLTACTTPVQDGMVIQTETEDIQTMRRGVLELILTEHTSACIVCKDSTECREFRGGPIKTGRVTGCRFCPENQDCEIIRVADYVGLEELRFPLEYKDLPLRRDDPFIERDGNLCILCGRCVRVCSQIRGREAISFLYRGHRAEIGTSFEKPLMDCGCMFCGACVDVCPTGSLSARSTKWHGEPDARTDSVCLLCGANCEFEFQSKWNTIMAAVPREGGRSRGQACVRGRFCLPSLLNSPDRLKYPLLRKDDKLTPVGWEKALSYIADKLNYYKADEIGFVASSTLTNEGFHLMQKLAREALGTGNVGTVGDEFGRRALRAHLGEGRGMGIASFEDVDNADLILVMGSDLLLAAPLLTVNINRARSRGAKLVLIDQSPANQLAEKADVVLRPRPGGELALLAVLVKRLMADKNYDQEFVRQSCENFGEFSRELAGLDGSESLEGSGVAPLEVEELLSLLQDSKRLVLVLGDDCGAFEGREEELVSWASSLLLLTGNPGGFVPVLTQGNSMGVTLLGKEGGRTPREMLDKGVRALYLTEPLPEEELEGVEFLVLQAPFPALEERADIILPTTAFTEEAGSVVSLEGHVHRVRPSAKAPALSKSDWEIFALLGKTLESPGFGYPDVEAVQREIEKSASLSITESWQAKGKEGSFEFMIPDVERLIATGRLETRKDEEAGGKCIPDFHYRGAKLADRVPDLRVFLEGLGRRGYHG